MASDIARASFGFVAFMLLALAWAVWLVATSTDGSWRTVFLGATVGLVMIAGACFCIAVIGVAN